MCSNSTGCPLEDSVQCFKPHIGDPLMDNFLKSRIPELESTWESMESPCMWGTHSPWRLHVLSLWAPAGNFLQWPHAWSEWSQWSVFPRRSQGESITPAFCLCCHVMTEPDLHRHQGSLSTLLPPFLSQVPPSPSTYLPKPFLMSPKSQSL